VTAITLLTSILLIVLGSVLTIIAQALNNRFLKRSTRDQRLQAKRDEYAARFRPLMADIIATVDFMRSSALRHDGTFTIDFDELLPRFLPYFSRLNAEPDCKSLARKLAVVQMKGGTYGEVEQRYLAYYGGPTALRMKLDESGLDHLKILGGAWAELDVALTDLEKDLHEHMKLLDTPVT
jgi:hypothetical protein